MKLTPIVKRSLFAVTVFVTTTLLLAGFFWLGKSNCLPATIGLDGYHLTHQNIKQSCFTELTRGAEKFISSSYFNQSHSDYLQTVHHESVALGSLYQLVAAPYPGLVSNQEGCGGEFRPKRIEKKGDAFDATFFLMAASKSYALGVCHQKFVAHQVLMGIVYCKRIKQTQTFKWFVSPDKQDRLYKAIDEVSCR